MSNSKIKTITIQRKEYVMVNEKVKFFRSEPQYKDWSIESDIIKHEDNDVIVKTVVRDNKGVIRSSGLAHEVAGSSKINSTSHVENCETSAIGRAMAGLGIGVDSSYSSGNEVIQAIAKQDAGISNTKPDLELTDDVFTNALNHLKKQTPQKRPMVLEKIRKEKKNQLTSAQYKKLEAV
jgi:hypothetical protein|tara:strand:- start:2009 stop:2545 length:537 start_codon:yes stop_codon:yes gene_type:complete